MRECSSNNTNKLSPQERSLITHSPRAGSNNTNKLSPQERSVGADGISPVQIIQINLVLKNTLVINIFEDKFK